MKFKNVVCLFIGLFVLSVCTAQTLTFSLPETVTCQTDRGSARYIFVWRAFPEAGELELCRQEPLFDDVPCNLEERAAQRMESMRRAFEKKQKTDLFIKRDPVQLGRFKGFEIQLSFSVPPDKTWTDATYVLADDQHYWSAHLQTVDTNDLTLARNIIVSASERDAAPPNDDTSKIRSVSGPSLVIPVPDGIIGLIGGEFESYEFRPTSLPGFQLTLFRTPMEASTVSMDDLVGSREKAYGAITENKEEVESFSVERDPVSLGIFDGIESRYVLKMKSGEFLSCFYVLSDGSNYWFADLSQIADTNELDVAKSIIAGAQRKRKGSVP